MHKRMVRGETREVVCMCVGSGSGGEIRIKKILRRSYHYNNNCCFIIKLLAV